MSKPEEKVENIENKVDDKQTEEKKMEENIDIPKDETKEIKESRARNKRI